MLRLIINKAKHHYNLAIEHAERNRYYQAITELQNSLDLDKNNIAAHVLLGTIYAKEDKFDLAIQEWQSALTLNPNLYKAYQYIERAEKVKSALPVLKWIKLLLAGLLVSLICIIILSFNIFRPHPSHGLIETAVSEYQNKRFGSAVEKTEIFSRKYDSSPFLPIAQLLKESIQKKMEEDKQKIGNLLQAGNYPGALEICNQLEAYHPDSETLQFLKHTRNETKFSMKESIEKSLAEHSKTKGDIALVKGQIEFFSRYFQDKSVVDNYNSQLAALEDQDKKKEQTDIQNELNKILTIKDPETALSELIRFDRLYPDFASRAFVPRSIQELKKTMYYDQFQIVQEFINQNDYKAAEETLAKLTPKELSEFPLLIHEYENFKSLLSRKESEQEQRELREYLETLEKSLASDDIPNALSLISRKDSYPLSESDLLRIQNIRGKIQTRQATQILHNIIYGKSIDNLEALSLEDAKGILSDLSLLKKDLPEDLYNRFKDHLLYISCASHMKLGENEQAQKIFQDLLHEFPYSPFLTRAIKILNQ
jgi:tetratricopeptide (TPR) repeat protein